MSLFSKLVQESLKRTTNKWRKHLIWFGLSVIVLISANILINHFVGKIVGEKIESLVREKSHGLYSVSWDKIGFIVNQNKFYLHNFDFKYNDEYIKIHDPDSINSKYLFDAEVDTLNLGIHDFWSILFEKRLHVDGIEIVNPKIEVIKLHESGSSSKISIEAGNMYELLSEHLKELRISDFFIKNGSFNHIAPRGTTTENFVINNLTFELKNFLLDSAVEQRDDKFLFTDDIYIELRNQRFLLKDSLHQLTFDRFYMSVQNNEVGFENLLISGYDSTTHASEKVADFSLGLPELRLTGVDFIRAFNDGELYIDSITIAKPGLKIDHWGKPQEKKARKSIVPQLLAHHSKVSINHFKLVEASLSLPDKEETTKYSVDNVSALISDIVIDTMIMADVGSGLWFNKVDLVIRDFRHTLPDSSTSFHLGEFAIESGSNQIRIANLSVNQQNSSGSINANLPYAEITGFDILKAIKSDTFFINEIYVENPELLVHQVLASPNKLSPAGIFGAYGKLRAISSLFELEDFHIKNGRISMDDKSQNSTLKNLDVNNISLNLRNIRIDSLSNYSASVLAGAHLEFSTGDINYATKDLGATSNGLLFNTRKHLIETTGLKAILKSPENPDSVSLSFPLVKITGFNEDSIFFKQIYKIDTLLMEGDYQFVKLYDSDKNNSDSTKNLLPEVAIKYLNVHNSKLEVRRNNLPLFSTDDYMLQMDNISIDHSLSPKPINQISFDRIAKLSIVNYTFFLNEQHHFLRAGLIEWINTMATLSIDNMRLKPFGITKGDRYFLDVPAISFAGIDLKRLLYDTYYSGDHITITEPKATLFLAGGQQKKLSNLDLGFIPLFLRGKFSGIEFNSLEIRKARLEYHKKNLNDSIQLAIKQLDLLVNDFQLDTASEVDPERFLFANDIRLSGQYLTVFYPGKSDFININRFGASSATGDIIIDGIYAAGNTKRNPAADFWKFRADKLDVKGFVFSHLTQDKTLRIRDVSLSKPIFQLVENVKKTSGNTDRPGVTFPLDTALVNLLDIGRISIVDGSVAIDLSINEKPKINVPYVDFSAGGVKLSPEKMDDSSRLLFSDEISAKIRSVRYVLSNGLNALSLSSASVSSKDSTIKVAGMKLEPLTGKYEYAPKVGYQATWLQLENDSITASGVDFLSILNNNHFACRSVDMDNFRILVFRDKRIEFPEWQRKNLPQTDLKKLNFTFDIAAIRMNHGYVTYQEHAEKAKTPGELFIQNIDARIDNATNDSSKIAKNPWINLEATANLFGRGNFRADFQFDMKNPENIHQYGIVVDSLDLTEFNRIMIPNAAVRITNGMNHKILMSAKANEQYSYGEMKFYYNDLRIALINRETETTRGFGQALGSFFANTFIIKTNNPSNFVLRKGDVFFERDEKRAIFNYWTKTFLSGVVSSIGAVNNKKKLRRMQEENLKAIREKEKLEAANN